MKITASAYNPYQPPVSGEPRAPLSAAPSNAELTALAESAAEEVAAFLEISAEGESRHQQEKWSPSPMVGEDIEAAALKQSQEVKDESGRLTRQLVAASRQEEVRTILSEAYKNMGDLRLIAMTGDGKVVKQALAALKRLGKLINRAGRKIRDLDGEDGIRRKAKRAAKQNEEAKLRELQAELKRRIAERVARERKYLKDVQKPREEEDHTDNRPTIAQLQAQFAALQMAINQLTVETAPTMTAEGGTTGEGGEATSSEGGGLSAGGGEGGGDSGGGEVAVAAE